MAASSAGTQPAGPGGKADVFKRLDRRSLARHAADHIKALIASGSLAPGDRLPPERELAVRLGVSRPTLREAVGALVIIGLLESRQGAGTFVARTADEATATGSPNATTVSIDIGEDPLGALFELRLLLEPTAAERAATRISTEKVAGLRQLFEDMVECQGHREQFIRLDVEFHRQIQVAAGSTLILSMLDRINSVALRSRTLSGRAPGVAQRTVDEHHAILEALEAHDAFLAKAAMTAHLMHIRGLLIGPAT
jgi:GntR family transcriptional repressor for pyruvate dehydrogenase complex